MNTTNMNRRGFIQVMGASALASRGICSSLASSATSLPGVRFVYVGSNDAIDVFAVHGERWSRVERVTSERPAALVISPDKRFLYIANEISEHHGLPVGTVESFAVQHDGRLRLLNRQALSLSATMPRHLSISPDGSRLVATAKAGGVYNLLPIAEDGSVGRASGILKEIGTASAAARPQAAVFDRAGRIVSADHGTGRLSLLAVTDAGFASHARTESEGTPLDLALSAGGRSLYVAHGDALERYEYTADGVGAVRQRFVGAGVTDGSAALAVHPAGTMLFATHRDGGVAAWTVDATGALRPAGRHAEELGALHAIALTADGSGLIAINRERGSVMSVSIDASNACVSGTAILARVDAPRSLAVL